MSSLVLLGVHVEHMDFTKVATVAAFGVSQILWANGLNAIMDHKAVGATKKDDDAAAGDAADDADGDGDGAPPPPAASPKTPTRGGELSKAATAPKVDVGDAYALAGGGFVAMVVLGLDIILHIEKMPGTMNPVPFVLVSLTILLLMLYSVEPVALKHRALGEMVIFLWANCFNGVLAYTLHRDPIDGHYALASVGCALVRPLANFSFNVRDAPADHKGKRRTLAIHLGASGIKKAYVAVPLLLFPAATACLLHTGHEILAVNLLAPWGLNVAYDALAKSPNALAEEARFYDYTQATTCALSAVQFLQVLRDFL